MQVQAEAPAVELPSSGHGEQTSGAPAPDDLKKFATQ